jgi:CAAX protease family protein
MIPMQTRPALWSLAAVFLLVCMGGLLYASFLSIPARIALPVAAAVALEACLYAAAVLEPVRAWIESRLRPARLAACMVVSAVLPYCVYSISTGVFQADLFVVLAAAAVAVSFWFLAFGSGWAARLIFVAFVAVVLMSPLWAAVFTAPAPRLPLAILGQTMWTRLAFMAVLSIARIEVKGFGFVPARREWAIGFANFALFVPPGAALGWALGFAAFHSRPVPWWQAALIAAGTFLGMLWVVALREEFFFRGLLQDRLGLAATSVLFGLVHLPFRGFPNWRFAILAAVAGIFYGRAYQQARSVRAAMVTHALVNTLWRVFF